MRTIVSGTVNGMAFSLKEDGKTVCKESKYCSLISDIAKQALDKAQEKIKQGLHPTAVFVITTELEKCKDVDIRVNKFIKCQDNIEEIHYYHMPEDKDNSKMLFLQGKFKSNNFKVLVDHATQVLDAEGKIDKANTMLLWYLISHVAIQVTSPSAPNLNERIYQKLLKDAPDVTIEKACIYHYPIDPNVIY